ncbi:hypothetical protein H7U37_12750 [Pseudoflavonifractor phocaeensis]|uniref:hypothetical protein n=1 Tax=Pseudoflavonifractor phocaeensis TaxID=1870988 RepID=UPI00195AAADA|nr:hypothetical protein [Pseudoflavonifractor phocaeensis]MBM6939382.1 hypothetical protein [Pseudoflavonifractor phocaeensis]
MKYPTKVRIRGVTGLGRWHWLERWTGRKDWNRGQIQQVEAGCTAPWVEQRHHYYASYCNELYLRSVQELEPLALEVAGMVEELKGMARPNLLPQGGCEEEARRLAEAQAVRAASQAARRTEILVRLAEIRCELENRAQALEHLLEKSRETLEAHTAAYWSGVLAMTDHSLPSAPVPCEHQLPGKMRYEAYHANLIALLEQGLGEGVVL